MREGSRSRSGRCPGPNRCGQLPAGLAPLGIEAAEVGEELAGQLEPSFDKTWRLPDIEPLT